MATKHYVSLKPCEVPHLELQWNGYGGREKKFIDVTERSGLGYYEDDKGYYFMSGELICTLRMVVEYYSPKAIELREVE